jgi:tight adherence protein C
MTTDLLSIYRSLPWQLIVAGLAGVLALATALLGWRVLFPARSEVALRLERAVGESGTNERGNGRRHSLLGRLLSPLAWLVKPSKSEELSGLRQKLQHAGMRGSHAMEVVLGMKVILGVALPLVFVQVNRWLQSPVVFPLSLAVGVWLCGGGYLLPNWWLHMKIQARQRAISHALPDAMDLMVTCVEAGLGLDAAISRVSQEIVLTSPILGSEMNLTFLEVQAGIRRADAFRRLAERTGVGELRVLSAMLIQAEMFGTSVAKAFRIHSEGIRIRRMQKAEERAAMVGVKMTVPLVLCILPALMTVVIGPALVSISQQLIGGR